MKAIKTGTADNARFSELRFTNGKRKKSDTERISLSGRIIASTHPPTMKNPQYFDGKTDLSP